MPSSSWFQKMHPYRDDGLSKEQHIAHVCCYSRAWASVEQRWAEGGAQATAPTRPRAVHVRCMRFIAHDSSSSGETDLIEAARCYAHCQISVRCSPRASTRGSRSTWCAHGRSRCHQSTERRRLLQKCWLTRNVTLRVRVGGGKHPRGDGCQPEHFPAAIATQSSVLVRIESPQCLVNNSGRMQAITARQELLDSESGKGQVSRGPLRDPRTIVH